MTSQREVINAFLEGENAPHRASNFRMEVAPDGYTAYLIGDGRVVFGKREMMRQFHIHTGHVPFGYDMPVTKSRSFYHVGRTALNSQGSRVQRRCRYWQRHGGLPDGGEVHYHDNSPPPTIDQFNEDFGIFAEVDDEPE